MTFHIFFCEVLRMFSSVTNGGFDTKAALLQASDFAFTAETEDTKEEV